MSALDLGRVVLVEDHSLFAEALETALGIEGYDAGRVVIDEGMTPGQLVDAVVRLRPGTVLLDLDLGHFGSGMPLIRPLTETGVHVVVVTANADRTRWGEALFEGAHKVLPKSAAMSEVVGTIRRIVGGLALMRDDERAGLIREWRLRVSDELEMRARLDRLTRREAEVLSRLMVGRQVNDIAREFYVSESTVRTQVKSILAKLHVTSQLAAVGMAHRVGWRPAHSPSW